MKLRTAACIGVGATVAVVAAPLALGAAGFTAAGIAAGSIAANMMSAAAIANGGGVAAGSLVAILQSAGAVGLSGAATAAGASTGGALGLLTSFIWGKVKGGNVDDPRDDDVDNGPVAEAMLKVTDLALK